MTTNGAFNAAVQAGLDQMAAELIARAHHLDTLVAEIDARTVIVPLQRGIHGKGRPAKRMQGAASDAMAARACADTAQAFTRSRNSS